MRCHLCGAEGVPLELVGHGQGTIVCARGCGFQGPVQRLYADLNDELLDAFENEADEQQMLDMPVEVDADVLHSLIRAARMPGPRSWNCSRCGHHKSEHYSTCTVPDCKCTDG